eukprot:6473898-Amphidinium_carterae.1
MQPNITTFISDRYSPFCKPVCTDALWKQQTLKVARVPSLPPMHQLLRLQGLGEGHPQESGAHNQEGGNEVRLEACAAACVLGTDTYSSKGNTGCTKQDFRQAGQLQAPNRVQSSKCSLEAQTDMPLEAMPHSVRASRQKNETS